MHTLLLPSSSKKSNPPLNKWKRLFQGGLETLVITHLLLALHKLHLNWIPLYQESFHAIVLHLFSTVLQQLLKQFGMPANFPPYSRISLSLLLRFRRLFLVKVVSD